MANFSLDTALRDACASDLKNRCQHSLAEIDKDANVRESALNCLQTYKEELEGDQCKSEVRVWEHVSMLAVMSRVGPTVHTKIRRIKIPYD